MDIHNPNSGEQVNTASISPSNKLEKLSLIILLVTIILSAVVFSTSSQSPIDSIKTIVLSLGILISSILYSIVLFKKKTLYIPNHLITYSISLIALSTIISTFFSNNFNKSLFGQGFEFTTTSYTLLMILAAFLVIQLVYKNKERFYYILSSLFAAFGILMIFHVVRLFDSSLLSFGVFNSSTASLIGRWSDLGVFSGLIMLIAFFTLNLTDLKGIRRAYIWILFILSSFFVVLVNNPIIWAILALIFLGYGIYNYRYSVKAGFPSKISFSALALFVVSLVLTIWGSNIASPLIKSLKVQSTEINLPWQLSLDIASDVIKNKPIFGAGPNRFASEFLLNKPRLLNQTIFWNVEFNSGSGYVPNFVITNGLLGLVSWLLFLIFIFILGINNLNKQDTESSRFAVVSTFFLSVFSWLMLCLYNPSHFVVFTAFLVIGLFISTSAMKLFIKTYELKKYVIAIAGISIIILFVWTFSQVKKTIALAYFNSGIGELSKADKENLDGVEDKFKKATTWDNSDIFYQALSEVNILKINELTQSLQSSKSSDSDIAKKIGELIEKSVNFSKKAIEIDPTNHYNHIALARISELASTLQIPNAYENSRLSYINAINLNPYNPGLYLNLARLEASKNNLNDAQVYIGNALQLKQDYIEAIFLLSQLQVSQGKIKDAITSVQVASQINPNDPLLFFQLGFLHYNDKNYSAAVEALSKAVSLNDQYANARYFLGLSYARLGRNIDAIPQFDKLLEANPDNQEVQFILSNLQAGKSPFADVKPPVDNKPEQRKTLPVKEKTAETSRNKITK